MPRPPSPANLTSDILTPFDLVREPQLAALSILVAALEAARIALLARHPRLIEPDNPHVADDHEHGSLLAERFLDRAHDMYVAVQAYRAAIANDPWASQPDDHIPF